MMAVCFGRIFVSRQTIFLSTVRYFANSSSALFKVGDEVEVRRVVSMRDVQQFARITGDTNPIHLDEKFAKKTQVGQLIVHGVILNGIISAIHGTKLPGPGCMIMSQSLKYPAPLFPGEEVLAHIQFREAKLFYLVRQNSWFLKIWTTKDKVLLCCEQNINDGKT
ncbi:hypothetical protein ACROYT_G040408 [Oculina patagonica]